MTADDTGCYLKCTLSNKNNIKIDCKFIGDELTYLSASYCVFLFELFIELKIEAMPFEDGPVPGELGLKSSGSCLIRYLQNNWL